MLKRTGLTEQVVERSLSRLPYTQLANVTGRPAISLPPHWAPDGLPLGVQFVGRLGAEGLLLRLGRQLEQVAPWHDRRGPLTPPAPWDRIVDGRGTRMPPGLPADPTPMPRTATRSPADGQVARSEPIDTARSVKGSVPWFRHA